MEELRRRAKPPEPSRKFQSLDPLQHSSIRYDSINGSFLDSSIISESMLRFPDPGIVSRYGAKFQITQLSTFKRGKKLAKVSKSKERSELKELGNWMERRMKELGKGRLSPEEFIECRQLILNHGLGRLIGECRAECQERGELLESIVRAVLDLSNHVLEIVSSSYRQSALSSQKEIKQLHQTYQDYIDRLTEQTAKKMGELEASQRMNTQIIERNRTLAHSLQVLKKQLKSEQTKNEAISEVVRNLMEENLFLHLERGGSEQAWMKQRYKAITQSVGESSKEKALRLKNLVRSKVEQDMKWVVTQIWRKFNNGENIDINSEEVDAKVEPEIISPAPSAIKAALFQSFGVCERGTHTDPPARSDAEAQAAPRQRSIEIDNIAKSHYYLTCVLKDRTTQTHGTNDKSATFADSQVQTDPIQFVEEASQGRAFDQVDSERDGTEDVQSYLDYHLQTDDINDNDKFKSELRIGTDRVKLADKEQGQEPALDQVLNKTSTKEMRTKHKSIHEKGSFQNQDEGRVKKQKGKLSPAVKVKKNDRTKVDKKNGGEQEGADKGKGRERESNLESQKKKEGGVKSDNSSSSYRGSQKGRKKRAEEPERDKAKEKSKAKQLESKKGRSQSKQKEKLQLQLSNSSIQKEQEESLSQSKIKSKSSLRKSEPAINPKMRNEDKPQRKFQPIIEEDDRSVSSNAISDTGNVDFLLPTKENDRLKADLKENFDSFKQKVGRVTHHTMNFMAGEVQRRRSFVNKYNSLWYSSLIKKKQKAAKARNQLQLQKSIGVSELKVMARRRKYRDIKKEDAGADRDSETIQKIKDLVTSFSPNQKQLLSIQENSAGWKKAVSGVLKVLRETIVDVAKSFRKENNPERALSPLSLTVYEKFYQKYGLKQVAEKNLQKLVNYIYAAQHSLPDIRLLGKLLGLHHESSSQDFAIYVRMICYVDATRQILGTKEVNLTLCHIKQTYFRQLMAQYLSDYFNHQEIEELDKQLFVGGREQVELDFAALVAIEKFTGKLERYRPSALVFGGNEVTQQQFLSTITFLRLQGEKQIYKHFTSQCDTVKDRQPAMTRERYIFFCVKHGFPTISALIGQIKGRLALSEPWTLEQLAACGLEQILSQKIRQTNGGLNDQLWRWISTLEILDRRVGQLEAQLIGQQLCDISKAYKRLKAAK